MSRMRDARFAGFAKLVLDEMLNKSDGQTDPSQWWENQAHTIIARRAYDFACHIAKHVETGLHISNVPDMIELPEELKEAHKAGFLDTFIADDAQNPERMTLEQFDQSIINYSRGKEHITCNPPPLMVKNSAGEFIVIDGKTYKLLQKGEQEQPACKMRRFLMYDEFANVVEGVKWPSGWVSLDRGAIAGLGVYESWEAFKAVYDGSGVQWIDQEVSDEPSN